MTTAAQDADRSKRNRAAFWNGRQAAAKSNKELAGVLIDYARAVATSVSGGSADDPVWQSLASHLHTWCQAQETAAQQRHTT